MHARNLLKRILTRPKWIASAVAIGVLAVGCSRQDASDFVEVSPDIQGELISTPQQEAAVTEAAPPQPAPAEAAPAQTIKVADALPAPEAEAPAAVSESSATPAPAVSSRAARPRKVDGYVQVSFEELAGFEYDVPESVIVGEAGSESENPARIPDEVKALDQERVALQGFMLPLKIEGGLVTEMLIMRDQSMCCYGTVPRINEWVSVKMTNKGVRPAMDEAVTLFGRLHVGEMRENGYLVGIYKMDGERLAGPQDL